MTDTNADALVSLVYAEVILSGELERPDGVSAQEWLGDALQHVRDAMDILGYGSQSPPPPAGADDPF
jgi:hypothetical protein